MNTRKVEVGINGDYFDDIIRRYKGNKPDTLEDQLNAFREIGFREADYYYFEHPQFLVYK
jgi:hypothetical protein